MVKPLRSLLLLILVILCFGVVALPFFPTEIKFDDFTLKIPKMQEIWEKKDIPKYADISNIQNTFDKKNNPSDTTKNSKKPKNNSSGNDFVYIPDSLKLRPEWRIQYPDEEPALLHNFFRELNNLKKNDSLVRVLHYGDSQLEGDRITSYLREKFQETFGGSGVGMATIVDKLSTKASILQNTKSFFSQKTMYGVKYSSQGSQYYGILGEYYKPEPEMPQKWTKAFFSYYKSQYATPKQQKIENAKLMFRSPNAPFEITLYDKNKKELAKKTIEKSANFGVFDYELENDFEEITVGIGVAKGNKSPELYGMALDSKKGITFDNIPLRGSSGIEFSRTPKAHLRKQYEDLNVKFLILQFGVNIVPNPLPDYKFYEDLFYEQLVYLKSIRPDLCILVVGVSDMSRNVNGNYETYPNIEKIRDAQKNASFKAKCAFWDLYEAMGGKNSMPSWVFAKPIPLANKDFTHFTPRGAEVVGEMLYKALLTEYSIYQNNGKLGIGN